MRFDLNYSYLIRINNSKLFIRYNQFCIFYNKSRKEQIILYNIEQERTVSGAV